MIAAPPARLAISARDLAALRRRAEAAYPDECCALLLGGDGDEEGGAAVVTRIVLAANVHPEPRRAFELDPAVLIATLRGLRAAPFAGTKAGERVLGHVHSHPDAPARPSARDRKLAHEAGLVWMIIPVRGGRAGAPRAWLATAAADGRANFRPLPLDTAGEAATGGAETA